MHHDWHDLEYLPTATAEEISELSNARVLAPKFLDISNIWRVASLIDIDSEYNTFHFSNDFIINAECNRIMADTFERIKNIKWLSLSIKKWHYMFTEYIDLAESWHKRFAKTAEIYDKYYKFFYKTNTEKAYQLYCEREKYREYASKCLLLRDEMEWKISQERSHLIEMISNLPERNEEDTDQAILTATSVDTPSLDTSNAWESDQTSHP